MGKQFLEHAKKVQAEQLKKNTKVMDVYRKSIDYLPEIKTIIRGHGKDLSKPIEEEEIQNNMKLRKRRSNLRLTK